MTKVNLEEVLVGKKMEPRYLEYNWRDVALYALAVGAHKEDLQYTYEKYLKAIPTYGTIPYWGTVNVKPYQWMPLQGCTGPRHEDSRQCLLKKYRQERKNQVSSHFCNA